MTTQLDTAPRAAASRTSTAPGRVTLAGATAAEWIKFRSVRSTVWTLVITVALLVGISTLAAWASIEQVIEGGGSAGGMNTAQLLSAGYQLAQLGVAVLGVLIVTGEYATGLVRSTFTAVPGRTPVLWAKGLVLTGAVLAATLVAMALSYLATVPFHDELGATLDLADPDTLRMTVGLPLYLAAVGLFAFAVGALVRHSAAALTVVIALLLVVENVLTLVPVRAVEVISPFLPTTAGRRILFDPEMVATVDAATSGAHLTPWQGFAVLLAWALSLLALAGVLLRRRDA